jgi:hypothetical protein
MSKRFIRRKEDFVCEKCGSRVVGDGFTNHCPHCLYSKHVDVNPGDRGNPCGGLMEPVSVESKTGSCAIVHRCTKCGAEKKNKSARNDSQEAILAVARSFAKKEKR